MTIATKLAAERKEKTVRDKETPRNIIDVLRDIEWHDWSISEQDFQRLSASDRIRQLDRDLRIAELKNKGTLANNLCPDHRDKQQGKPCLACVIEKLERELTAANERAHEGDLNLRAAYKDLTRVEGQRDKAEAEVKAMREALDTLMTEVESLDGYTLTRNIDAYKAQACWDYAVEKANAALAKESSHE